jgi:hypothetical protein
MDLFEGMKAIYEIGAKSDTEPPQNTTAFEPGSKIGAV